MKSYIAESGVPYKPTYIEQGTKLTCQCGYEWIENRFPEYVVCPRCDRRQFQEERRNLVQSSRSARPLQFRSKEQSAIDEVLNLLNFGSIDPMVLE